MKSGRVLRVVILLIVIAVLIGAVILIKNLTNEKDDSTQKEEVKKITLTQFEPEDIVEISYSYADSQQITFLCENGKWLYADDADFPLTQNYLLSIVDVVSEVLSLIHI